MKRPLRLLLVDDSEDSARLVLEELQRAGYDLAWQRVDDRAAFRAAFERGSWDVVVSGHPLPAYGALEALADLRSAGLSVPFLVVSRVAGEAEAVAVMKAGAQDYVLRNDLTRLPAAVDRERSEASQRADQDRARAHRAIDDRMACACSLAAGVAHQINNPLAVAIANLEILADASSGGEWHWGEVEEPVHDLRDALRRIRDVVRDVKVFARPQDASTGEVDVHRVIDCAIRMAGSEIRHRARLVKTFGEIPSVEANESRLGQVVLNLLMNAALSIPAGHADTGEIRVSTRKSATSEVVLEVADSGAGIQKDHLDKIFDPFFTLRSDGAGAGLGLSICHRVVNELGGRFEVESEPGKGAVFRVLLPARQSTGPGRAAPAASQPPTARRRGRVLVVDDEAAIGRLLLRTLVEHHDLTVLTSGAEAITRLERGQRFDVILSDLMMPGVTGMDIHAHLTRILPDQASRMVFITGGVFTVEARRFLEEVPNPRIEKPFELENLLAIIDAIAVQET